MGEDKVENEISSGHDKQGSQMFYSDCPPVTLHCTLWIQQEVVATQLCN